jgi:hypothetical protein
VIYVLSEGNNGHEGIIIYGIIRDLNAQWHITLRAKRLTADAFSLVSSIFLPTLLLLANSSCNFHSTHCFKDMVAGHDEIGAGDQKNGNGDACE